MSQHAYEIASWPASEEYLKDPGTVGTPLFSWAIGKNGTRVIYHAPVEGESRIGVVVQYESYQHFKTLTTNVNGAHTALREKFAPMRAQAVPSVGLHKVIATLTSDPIPALQAPLTAVTVVTPNPGTDAQSLAETLGKLVAAVNSSATPALGVVQGSVIDKPESLVLITGWKSLEEYKQVVEIDNKDHLQEIESQSTSVAYRYRFIEVKQQ